MSIYVLVPVKTLSKSKERLSLVLKPRERQSLTLFMLEDILRALKASEVYQICVIGSDMAVQESATKFRASYLSEGSLGLNQAVEQATIWCIQNNAETSLVLPADIPLITRGDINKVVELGSEETSVVVSPSRNGGTNALLRKPANLISSSFGPHSFVKHVEEASAKGVVAKIYSSPRVALDIDNLEDLEDFLRMDSQTSSHRFLEQIRVKDRLGR